MAETDTDAVEQLDAAQLPQQKLDEGTPGLWQRYRRLPRNVFAISLVSLLNDASSEIIYPLLPLFLSVTLNASPAIIGYIEGATESVSSLLKLFAGYFSDRRSKRKGLVVFGYGLASFTRPVLAFATSWPQVFAIRLMDRVGKGIRSAPRDAMIADSVSVKERGLAFGFHRAMDHAGAVIGPLIGYVLIYFIAADRNALAAIDYKKIFLVASLPAMAAVFVVGWLVRETPPEQRAGVVSNGSNYKASDQADANNKAEANNKADATRPARLSLRGFDGNFKIFLVLVALFTLSNSTDAFLIKRANDVGVSMLYIPLLWAALHAVKVLSSLIGGDLSDRMGRRTLIVSGWLLYALVYAGFAFITSAGAAWALFLIYGIYFGLAEGTEKALVADLVRPAQRGTAFGLYNLAFGITVLPASILMGKLWKWYGAETAFITSAIIGASAALLLMLLVHTKRPEPNAI